MDIATVRAKLHGATLDPIEGGDLLRRFLCHGPEEQLSDWTIDPKHTRLGRLVNSLRAEGRRKHIAFVKSWMWSARDNPYTLYFLRQFNADYGHSNAIVEALLRDPDDSCPYLYVLLQVLSVLYQGKLDQVNHALRLRNPAVIWQPLIRDLCDDASIPGFLQTAKMAIRYYGGATNTVLRLYDKHVPHMINFNREAGFYGDLGGGYATADLSRATGLGFTSLDVNDANPYAADPDYLPIRISTPTRMFWTDRITRRAYLDRQAKTPWIPWSVLDPTPLRDVVGDYPSYGFTSTGFLTSTIAPLDKLRATPEHTFHDSAALACQRVMELVAAGKDVSLFTVERAGNKARQYKSCMLRWQQGRLVTMHVEDKGPIGFYDGYNQQRLLDALDPAAPQPWWVTR